MYADFIGSAGRYHKYLSFLGTSKFIGFSELMTLISFCSIFDLCTPLYPSYFLPLASLGNLAKVFS